MNSSMIKLFENINGIENFIYFLKIFFLCIFSYYTLIKIINRKIVLNNKLIFTFFSIFIISMISFYIKNKINSFAEVLVLAILLSILVAFTLKNDLGYSIVTVIIALSINYIIFVISIFITFIPNIFWVIDNNYINLGLIEILHAIFLFRLLKIPKIKYGISFLKRENQNSYFELIIFNVSICILFSIEILSNIDLFSSRGFFVGFIILAVLMFITIQKSLQLYYKQKMLIKDLKETKEELDNKKKEIAELEAENIRISKKRHTIVHKQKSLEYKLSELLTKTEISTEDATEIKERLEKLKNDIYDEKEIIELDKTGVTIIDDMLKCMHAECQKYKIEFTLVLKGNIHYMINNLISKEELETLLADHIKDAIIAVNHADNINKSILVKLGNIDGIYGLYIYDSGVEFKKETLDNLGKKPVTTYSTEGGTGMGFMNTFDTLRKHKASLIIEEIGKPSVENYTKVLMIKFDGKNEFLVNSYKECK